jgi:hypothetical protein
VTARLASSQHFPRRPGEFGPRPRVARFFARSQTIIADHRGGQIA